jgi:hypothetical protein
VVAIMGWVYMKTGRYSFIADAVRGFVDHNPKLFHQPRKLARFVRRKRTKKDAET